MLTVVERNNRFATTHTARKLLIHRSRPPFPIVSNTLFPCLKSMIFLLAITSLGVTGLLLLVHAALFAPEGEEDAQGFHYVVSRNPETTASVQHSVEHGGLSVVSR